MHELASLPLKSVVNNTVLYTIHMHKHPKQADRLPAWHAPLFGSDDEDADAEAERLKEERIAAYSAKKSKKPVLIAKSSILLDVKPVCGSIIFPSLAKPLQQLFHLCVLACIIYCVVFVIGWMICVFISLVSCSEAVHIVWLKH